MKFTEFKFKDYIQEVLKDLNFVEATEVQEKLIPVVLAGRDLVGESKTGSGKTHTFLLPIFQKLNEDADSVQVVITAPSRELARQIYQAARQIAAFSDKEIRVANYVGGTDKNRQIGKLAFSQPHIVIGTPGRIYDLVKSGDLAIHKANTFVVDEADMTLDMGFLETVDKIASSLPKELQFLVFSATIPQKLQPFLKKYLSNPVIEQIKTKTVISDTIENWLISTKGQDKNAQIYQITQLLQPYLAMIFVNTKTRADELHSYLTAQGLKVAKIHGDVPPRERKRIMNQVKNLEFEYIVATDLAARGIDIEGVSHVINDAIPQDLSFFIHRVGRTGRNGLPGTAITLYQPSDDSDIRELEKLGIQFIPKMIKADEFQDTYDRDRRSNREKRQEKLDTEMIGLVKKKKKKIKPGYKKKIQWAVNEKRRKTKRAENRARGRAERKAKRQSF
ncbi:DEAD/DEAH box helicase [Streptococcus constellatus subsp. pharyngis]|uniref:DEAD-box ATP-dependent RNA helicase CshB n=1 Tax=Streptococcus constellatus subsp. pharyngis SK1060 = CCUG 46377 TaxID=1035184 RepID=U2YDB1_STRCV|nr:DEAD/DEAH box helicase [Streptococcus constellatus]AGU72252.1 ATP-dependent RNA helicase [Streptococcus constellatus subsp. pharyngis C232]AGU74008.1 ATP-dependent RNA helicase [Streptococcus constellatus subsp. pharyngis C818]AGU79376.1 ATP-dependent RNA helicase [Streptococcus constellatus subsp. pharyngis C1050]QRP81707.1 DEAD/DEAH box helicase [Streptococcus constellatus]GAD44992.1 superfamily II DNA/RNA helicases [Streptococcus constellatus subsp. pharyngis SK1060 = CCUG 46377]